MTKVPDKEKPAQDCSPKTGLNSNKHTHLTIRDIWPELKQKMRSHAFFCTCLVLLTLYILFPEWVWAVKLEDQLETVNTLATGKFKTIGVTGATITGFVWAIFKGNPKLAGIIVALGLMMGFYLNWVLKGMNLG